jgi:glycosyltransferase involved in cell wall biosynthesis
MAFGGSRAGKAWVSISKHGLRAGVRDAFGRWLRTKFAVTPDVLRDYPWILTPDAEPALKSNSPKSLAITWLIPDVGPGVGGLFNIFRAIQQMEQWGHRHRIYIVGNPGADSGTATRLARRDYFPIGSEVDVFRGEVADSDALVATSWQTAYAARGLSNTARKFYLVQDLEHLFYAPGSISEFARQTYQWGFHGITAGSWIAKTLRADFGMNCSSFGFSYDRGFYAPEGKRMLADGKKRILFYARPSTERRGFELGMLALSIVAKKMPETEFVLVGFTSSGATLPFNAVIPGVLSPLDLAALYRSCTAALILSFTNLSLLPLEVMACGCVVVSNQGANVNWLINQEIAELGAPNPEALAASVLRVLQNDDLRAQKAQAALRYVQSTDWSKEIKAIESGFYEGLGGRASHA